MAQLPRPGDEAVTGALRLRVAAAVGAHPNPTAADHAGASMSTTTAAMSRLVGAQMEAGGDVTEQFGLEGDGGNGPQGCR